jgi:hypothetical protein
LLRIATRAHNNRLLTDFNLPRELRDFKIVLRGGVSNSAEAELLLFDKGPLDTLVFAVTGRADLGVDQKDCCEGFPAFSAILDLFHFRVVGFDLRAGHPGSGLGEDCSLFGGFEGLLLLTFLLEDVERFPEKVVQFYVDSHIKLRLVENLKIFIEFF